MKKILIIGVTLGMLLAGCGAETKKAGSPGPSEKQRAEEAGSVEKSALKPQDESAPEEKIKPAVKCDPDVPMYKQPVECGSSESMQEAADALANDEMTLKDVNKLSDDEVISLGSCQLYKYQQMYGEAGMNRWIDDFADDVASASSGDIVSFQEKMIMEGVTCTFQEMNQVAATGTLGEQ